MEFQELLQAYKGMLIAILVTLSVIVYYWYNKEAISLFWLSFTRKLPLIGGNARAARKTQTLGSDGWLATENDLLNKFHGYYSRYHKNPDYYDNCKNYLKKVQELGRKPLGFFGWAGIILLVLAESVGFSYVLSGYVTGFTASEDTQRLITGGLSLVISFMLVFLTHQMGEELHKNELIGKLRVWSRRFVKEVPAPDEVSIEDDYKDDHAEAWQKLNNRINTNAKTTKTFKATITTVIIVLAIAIASTIIRGKGIDQAAMEIVQNPEAAMEQGGGIFDDELPADVMEADQQANENIQTDLVGDFKEAAWTAFILLGFVFVVLQIISVLLGYFKSFAGKESYEAYDVVGRFEDRQEYASYFENKRDEIAALAQSCLSDLQTRLAHRDEHHDNNQDLQVAVETSSERSFLTFCEKKHKERRIEDERIEQQRTSSNRGGSTRPQIVATTPKAASPVEEHSPAEVDDHQTDVVSPENVTMNMALAALEGDGIDVDAITDDAELMRLVEEKRQQLLNAKSKKLTARERIALMQQSEQKESV